VRNQFDTAGNLFQCLNSRELHLSADPGHAAALGQAVFGVDRREVIAHEIADADARAAFFP
jgi:hypothetical protein